MPEALKFETNLEALAEAIGSYVGMAEGIEQKTYMDGLITAAHGKTVNDFVIAASQNARKRNFTHMYEFGVAGITRGNKQFINPLSPKARLWIDTIMGGGGKKTISFEFRDAVRRVPPLTEEDTGIDQEHLDKLQLNQGKRYIFKKKAEVFERGVDVNITPRKPGGTLFVPFRGDVSFRGSPSDQARGFVFAKRVRANPGQNNDAVGQFSAYFFEWWETEGAALLAGRMYEKVEEDVKAAEAVIEAIHGTLKTPRNTSISRGEEKGRRRTRKQFQIRARMDEYGSEKIL
jgi:hypothetical protein